MQSLIYKSQVNVSVSFIWHQGTARLMFNSFGSSLWMLPFTKYCRAENEYWKHLSGGIRKGHHTYQCEEQEFQSNCSGWPTNIVNIEIPSNRGKTSVFFPFFVGTLWISYSYAPSVSYISRI